MGSFELAIDPSDRPWIMFVLTRRLTNLGNQARATFYNPVLLWPGECSWHTPGGSWAVGALLWPGVLLWPGGCSCAPPELVGPVEAPGVLLEYFLRLLGSF